MNIYPGTVKKNVLDRIDQEDIIYIAKFEATRSILV